MKGKIKSIYNFIQNRMSFGTRLFAAFFAVAVPVMLIVSGALYIFFDRSSQENASRTMLQSLEQLRGSLEYVIEDTQKLSRSIIYDADVQALLEKAASGEEYPETDAVQDFINGFIVDRDYIESVVLVGRTDTLFSSERAYTNVSSPDQIRKKWWYPSLDEQETAYQWFDQAKRNKDEEDLFGEQGSDNCLMLTRTIRSLKDYTTPLGRMMIYLENDYIKDLIHSISWGDTLSVWVCSNEGRMYLANDSGRSRWDLLDDVLSLGDEGNASQALSGIIRLDGRLYVWGLETFGEDGWKLAMLVPLSEVNTSRFIAAVQIISMIVVILLVVAIVALVISRSLSRPVRRISQIMDAYHNHDMGAEKQDDGKLSLEDLKDRKDEVGTICRSYEHMVHRVDTLIRENYIKDLEKKDAQLALMQSQINPHFLYNTLDSINWMAMANGQDEISEMVTALSDTFRLSLRRTDSAYVQVGQELEYLNSYLTLQKYRYGERLSYHFQVPQEIRSLFLLRFLLQPVVENGIKHGIGLLDKGGCIDIKMEIVTQQDQKEMLMIHVINDGDKVDLARVEELLDFDVEKDTFLAFDKKGYGLQNINRRIKIVHGSQYGVSFSITKDGRTDCCLRLPAVIENGARDISQ